MVKQRPWQDVRCIFEDFLGCDVVAERPFNVILCRGAVKLQALRKLSPTTVKSQLRIAASLGFSEGEYDAACRAFDEPAPPAAPTAAAD